MVSKYIDIFLREAEEHVTSLQKGLLILEKEPGNTALIHDLLRNAHTLKGSARMVGLEDISVVAHRMEDTLQALEAGQKLVEGSVIDLLLRGSDAISRMTTALGRGEESPVDVEKFVAAFDQGEATAEAVQGAAPQEAEAFGDTVRAKVKTLDTLVNLIGELIINKKRFEDKTERLNLISRDAKIEGLREFHANLEEDVRYLDYLIQELHLQAMSLRMLPLKTITDGFQRMVRDLAKAQEKDIRLEIVGDSLELDRVLLESLKPMFIHTLNNAVDHGIEAPEERVANGKPAKGTIRINARLEGNNARIDIRDDGRGMDPDKIRRVALRRGVIDREEAELLHDDEVLYLTLKPGFSTSELVTDLSGRGVGMDVVKKNIEKVKGNLVLKSEVGSFTELTLHLPLTLSVIEALMVTCGGEIFAVPLTYVQETIKIRNEDITTVGGKEVVSVRGSTVPLLSLSALLGLPERKSLLDSGKITAIVVKQRDHSLACTIEGIVGSSEIVVKELGEQLKKVKYVFGATILGDGNPSLILDVPDIFASAEGETGGGIRRAFEESLASRTKGNILVVDDSITTRTMEQSILITHGYRVTTAISGEDALEKVANDNFDLVISDIEMPGINGFELTRRLRAIAAYRDVPVIIVSSLSRDEDKRNAIDAGAQAYIVKGSFEQGTLLDTAETLIG
ncbi:MAG TPA: hybrid sensor histidine kinase/response regulator [Geobacteraceae bacterium]|nr:hybrid sensor histidine kinase/response regulator [Geobacteraceae bacterium]